MKLSMNIYGLWWINLRDFGNPPTFSAAPLAGQRLLLIQFNVNIYVRLVQSLLQTFIEPCMMYPNDLNFKMNFLFETTLGLGWYRGTLH